ncbi:family 5 glycoside hydrolase [Cryphonectria parasitica EP155]|uniref:Mannan endo-1,4-beta-mannosidase A n=1 Tax=Cryphonectria parasitica (strain ATCC 38755 / EP155) TaxID=660469 RepID=A0A9P4XTH7_CRYP1|nr:family 5 glycoside hydrolase [Cryphonectria parasitica EP155]KAF3760942.1 family 5 glycoside hydrolase [Cryphonectria parasitica EP155]
MRFSRSSILWSALSIAPPPAYPIGQVHGPNAKVAGRLFDIDGKIEYFAGSNAWWLAHLSHNSDIDIALSEVAKTQYKILRVWGFGDVNTLPDPTNTDPNKVYFQVLNSTGSYINYGPDGLQRLDYAVHAAEQHGVKLVLNFVNNWSDYGGIAAYTAAFGANATEWFTDPTSQAVYRNYIDVVVSRYRASPAVFAWELANEPRCSGCDTSVLTGWAEATAGYIKGLDAAHLVTLGDEGWFAPADVPYVSGDDGTSAYDGSSGVDWVANLRISSLDYGTFHLYPDSWGYNYTWGNEWILQHDQVGREIGKPVILEEYGAPFPGNHTPYYKPWQDTVLKSGVAADQVWQFGTYDLSVPAANLGDVNSIYYNSSEYKVLGFKHAADMLNKKV